MIEETYNINGYYGPVKFLSSSELERYTSCMHSAVVSLNLMQTPYRCKANVLFPWIDDLSKHPTITEHVSAILGKNFHCWDALVWNKQANSENFVSFHQDATYWNFSPKEHAVTIWVTLSGATQNMGCLEYIPGSHNKQVRHVDIADVNNILMRGQTIETYLELDSVKVEAPAGSFLMHHPFVMHGSGPNHTDNYRSAIGFIYAATDVKPIETFAPESTVMISGEDSYKYMKHDPAPSGEWNKDIEVWASAYDRQHENYYKMEQKI